ncbi:MAG: nucleotidyl transferase AbiEii/AbiGii toxin family protein [Candidatus Shapirobacteria bacterium]|jgi:predicted nucleotidyltransferase component of viral defense system
MNTRIIEARLKMYGVQAGISESQALREITQELILYALSTSDFFTSAAFQGGTCLRILHGIDRFSEDMDFILKQANSNLTWQPWFSLISATLEQYGYSVEVQDKSKAGEAVKKAFVKDDSIGKILHLAYPDKRGSSRPVKIKLEVDTNPPNGSEFETKYIGFPSVSSVTVENLPTMLAGKSHALLCRKYEKGRDWYDFLWYMDRKIPVNYRRLSAALRQSGPWADKDILVDRTWYIDEMSQRIANTDWKRSKEDITAFITQEGQRGLDLWGQDLFLSALARLPE